MKVFRVLAKATVEKIIIVFVKSVAHELPVKARGFGRPTLKFAAKSVDFFAHQIVPIHRFIGVNEIADKKSFGAVANPYFITFARSFVISFQLLTRVTERA